MFGRKKKQEQAEAELETAVAEDAAVDAVDDANEEASEEVAESKQAVKAAADDASEPKVAHAAPVVKTDRSRGPLDASEVDDVEGLLDLGSLQLPVIEGMNLNLEVEQDSQQIVSVAVELEGSRVQIQAFAAPKSEGLWPGISTQIDQSVTAQGGRTDRRDGRFGPELLARVPSTGPDGSQGTMIARFVGVDGPRWFLRAVFAGPAAINEEAAQPLEDLLGRIVVDRGQTPMAPTELLPLTMPEADAASPLTPAPAQQGEAPEPASEGIDPRTDKGATPPERGPEITQIG